VGYILRQKITSRLCVSAAGCPLVNEKHKLCNSGRIYMYAIARIMLSPVRPSVCHTEKRLKLGL